MNWLAASSLLCASVAAGLEVEEATSHQCVSPVSWTTADHQCLPTSSKTQSCSAGLCSEYRAQYLLQLNEMGSSVLSADSHRTKHVLAGNATVHDIVPGPIAQWVLAHWSSFLVALACWVVLAWVSIVKRWVAIQAEEDKGRDRLWDIAKFLLITCVLDMHLGSVFNPHWYTECLMPAFFLISGLLQQKSRGGVLDASALSRSLRDNVLNNLLFYGLLMACSQDSEDGTLWFLWGLAFFRLCLFPLFHCVKERLGLPGVIGYLVVMSVFYCLNKPEWQVWTYIDAALLLKSGLTYEAGTFAFYYVLGLSLSYQHVRDLLNNRMLSLVSVALITLHTFSGGSVTLWSLWGTGLNESTKWLELIYGAVLSLAVLSCLNPIADIRQGPMQHIVSTVADLGSRTLYGYYLHMMFRFLLCTENFQKIWEPLGSGSTSLIYYVWEVLFMASLCSPLAETCFQGLVSPQWILDIKDTAVSQLKGALEPRTELKTG